VSSNAGPAPVGGTAIGILENGCAGSGSDDEKSLVHAQGLAESAQSTGKRQPTVSRLDQIGLGPGRLATSVPTQVKRTIRNHFNHSWSQ
jgi:hypothetical protein